MNDPNVLRDVGLSELTPVRVYLDVISDSQDPDEIMAASNLYSPLFDIDPPGTKSWEDYTDRVGHAVSRVLGEEPKASPIQDAVYSLEEALGGRKAKPRSPEERLLDARVKAVTHLVRAMIQGNQNFPEDRFSEVIDMCVETIAGLDDSFTPRKAKRFIRREIKEIWDPYIRSAEALKLVGAPGRLAAYKLGSSVIGLVQRSQSKT